MKSRLLTRKAPVPPIPRWRLCPVVWGEDQAFDYLKQLNANVSQYTKSGIAPARNAARGETAIGIGFLHDYSLEKEQGAPLELISPCEGTGYEIGGVSILKGARNLDNAKLFVDWVLSKMPGNWRGRKVSPIRS